jgi:hypothetical protein
MTNMLKWSLLAIAYVAAVLPAAAAAAGEWTPAVEVRHEEKLVLTYRARWDGEFLIVRAAIEPGWHTFVMDNKQRQPEKLAGKPSLGIEKSTEIAVTDGLNLAGPWLQSAPKDFSKPELRWFSWGFERDAIFGAKARRVGSGPAKVGITGQACAADICKNIDILLTVPVAGGKPDRTSKVDLKSLVQVR